MLHCHRLKLMTLGYNTKANLVEVFDYPPLCVILDDVILHDVLVHVGRCCLRGLGAVFGSQINRVLKTTIITEFTVRL